MLTLTVTSMDRGSFPEKLEKIGSEICRGFNEGIGWELTGPDLDHARIEIAATVYETFPMGDRSVMKSGDWHHNGAQDCVYRSLELILDPSQPRPDQDPGDRPDEASFVVKFLPGTTIVYEVSINEEY